MLLGRYPSMILRERATADSIFQNNISRNTKCVFGFSQNQVTYISPVLIQINGVFLNQARIWFLEITFMWACMCVYVCVHLIQKKSQHYGVNY